jgi:mannose/fructose/N-acetylgalactosamine-specific phosphotransferase system component IIB
MGSEMYAPALVRVDDRLIHGQVVVKWLTYLDCSKIWIVDDEAFSDPFMQRVLRLAAPAGVSVEVAAVDGDSSPLLDSLREEPGTMILVKSPEAALALLQRGVPFRELNVGGLASSADTTRLYKSVSASQEQIQALQCIQQQGVRVYYQMVPEERQVEMESLLRDDEACASEQRGAHSCRLASHKPV